VILAGEQARFYYFINSRNPTPNHQFNLPSVITNMKNLLSIPKLTMRANVFISILLATATASAANDTWSGASLTTGNWSDAGNWSTLPGSGDSLFFAGSTRLANTNDFTGYSFNGVTISSGAGGFFLYGNSFTLGGGITNSSSSSAVINNPMVLGASQTLNAASGGLTLAGVISDGGSGFGLTNVGGNSLVLLGVNTFSGGTTINGTGTTVITNDVALGAAGGGVPFTASGTLAVTNNGASVNNPVTLGATRTITVGSGVTANFQVLDTNNLTVASYITGAGNVTKKFSSYALGTVRFSNDVNDYTGDFTASYGNTEFTSVNNQGAASSLGKGAAGTGGQITLGNNTSAGTLRYVGTANSSTTRPLAWTATTGGYTLDVTSTGTIAYLGTANLVAGLGIKTLTLTGSNTGTNTLAQPISNDATNGVISLIKSGAGNWVLSGGNSFSGGTTLAQGSLSITTSNALGSGPLAVTEIAAANSTTNFLTVANGAALTVSNNIVLPNATTGTNTYVLTKNASGTLTLAGVISGGGSGLVLRTTTDTIGDKTTVTEFAGTNTFAGGVQLWRGVVQVDNPASLGVGTVYMQANSSPLGDLSFANNPMTFTNPLTMQGASTISNANAVTLSGVISGAYALTTYGTGNLTLSGVNTYSGATTISAGTLTIGGAGQLGSGTYAATITNNGAFVHNSSAGQTMNGVISGTGSVTQQSGGDLTLAAANTYSGGTTLAGAITRLMNQNTALGSGLVTVAANATLATQSGSSALSVTNPVSINSGVTLTIDSGYAYLTFKGPITNSGSFATTSSGTTTLNGTNTYTGTTVDGTSSVLTIGGTGSLGGGSYTNTISIGNTINFNSTVPQTLGGVISGGGSGGLNVGAGSLTLTNVNTYTAPTFINAGTLTIGGAGQLGSGTYAGNITDNAAFIYNSSASQTLSGIIAGTGTLTQQGSGTLTLSGANTYTGATTISAGELIGVGGSACGSITVANGATNGVQRSTLTGQFTCTGLTAGATGTDVTYADFNCTAWNPGATAPLLVNGNVVNNGTLNVIVRGGTLAVGTYPLIKYTGALTVGTLGTVIPPVGVTATLVNNTNNKSIDLSVTADTSLTALTWAVGNSTWDTSTANWTNVPAGGALTNYFDSDQVVFDDTASGASPITVTLSSTVNPTNVTANLNNKSYTISGGTIAGSGSLTKSGTNTLTLTPATSHTYSGATIVAAGVLKLAGSSGGSGTLPNSAIVVNTGAELQTAVGDATGYSVSQPLTVYGSLRQVNASSETLNRPITLNNGTITATNNGGNANAYFNQIGGTITTAANTTNFITLPPGGKFSLRGGSFSVGTNSLLAVNAIVEGYNAGGYSLNVSGPGTMLLNSNNTYTGTTTIGAGTTLTVGPASQLGGGTYAGGIANSGTFINNSSSSQTFAGVLSGAGVWTNAGTGTLTLTGTNTFTSPLVISAGTVAIGGSGSLNTNYYAANILNNGTLNIGTSTNQILAGIISGTGSLIKSGTGILTNSGVNTYTGTNLISGGLVVDGVGSTTAGAFGAYNASPTNIFVASGATVDINGKANANDFFYGLTIAGSGTSGQGALINNGSSGLSGNRSTPNITLSANATIGGSGDIYMVNSGHAADTLNLAGFTLTKTGANKFVLDNTAVTGGGTISISQGTISTFTAGSSASGTAFALANTAGVTLDVSVNNLSIGSLTGGGGTGGSVTLGSKTLTVGGDNTSPAAFAGVISGTGVLAKTGTGALTLSGTNTYSGATTVGAGTLALSGSGSISNTPTITVAAGALLDVSALTTPFVLGAAQTLIAGNAGTAVTTINGNYTSAGTNNIAGSGTTGVLTINGNLSFIGGALLYDLFAPATADLITLSGAGRTLSLSGTTTVTPLTGVVTNGTYTLINGISSIASGGAANLALTTTATNNIRGTPSASFTVSSPAVTLTISGEASTNLFWQGTTSGAWDINTTANWTNSPGGTSDKYFNQDTVNFDDTAAATVNGTNVILSTTLYPAAVNINNSAKIFGLGGAGSIAGIGALTKSGTALVVISNANTYVGGTTITAGTLRLATNNPNGLGTGTLTMTGGTLDMNSNSISILSLGGTAGTITDGYTNGGVAVTVTLTVNQVVSNTFAGTINNGSSNTVALVKNGTNYLLLSGANSYGGGSSANTTVNVGTLEVINNASGVGKNYTVAAGATLKLGYSPSDSFGYYDGETVNGVNSAADTTGLYLKGGVSYQFSALHSPGLTLQTAPSTVRAYGAGSPTLAGGDFNYNMMTIAATASGSILDPLINITCGSYGYRMGVTSGTNNANGDLLIGGKISSGSSSNTSKNGQTVGFQKYGTGSILLTNASTDTAFAGIWVEAGAVILAGGNNRLPATSGIALGDTGTSGQLILNGVGQTFTNIVINGTGTANAVVGGSATTSTLTINNAGTDTYAGILGGTGANQNNLALTKTGVGQLTLSGQLTYTNNTTISAGSVWASSLTNVDGATLSVVDAAGTLAATNLALGVSAGGTVAITSFANAASAPIVATNLIANGVTTITFPGATSGSFAVGQFPLIKYLSTKTGNGSFTLGALPFGVVATLVTNVGNQSIDLNVAYADANVYWNGNINGAWNIATTANWLFEGAAANYADGNAVVFNDTATGATAVTLTNTVNPGSVAFTNAAKSYSLSGSGTIAGAASLIKAGTGGLSLSVSNAYTGTSALTAGAVNLQNAYGLSTNTVTVSSGAELQLPGGITTANVPLVLNGTGTNGTGALHNLSGNDTYAGTITLASAARINSDGGTLTLNVGSKVNLGTNPLTVGGAGNISLTNITGSGASSLTKDGAGTVNFASGYNGATIGTGTTGTNMIVNQGTLQFSGGYFNTSPFGYGTLNILVNSAGTLRLNASHALGGDNIDGGTSWGQIWVIGGTLDVEGDEYVRSGTANGLGRLVLQGANVIGAGDLRGTSYGVVISTLASSVPSVINCTSAGGAVQIPYSNTTFDVARGTTNIDLVISGGIAGSYGFIKTNTGIMQLNGTNTYSGVTLVNAGTLNVFGPITGGGAMTNRDGTTLNVGVLTGKSTITNAAALTLGATGSTTLGIQNFAGSTTAPVYVTNLTANGTVTVVVTNTTARNLAVGQWPLIKYTGSIGGAGFGAFTLAPLPRGVVAVLVNNTVNSSVDLNVLANDQITWNGNVVGGIWDTNNTANWTWNGSATTYQQPPVPGDGVLFDDTATGTTAVVLNQTVTPLVVVFNNTTNSYSLSGSGAITGTASLIKNGTNSVTLATANTYTGTTTINAGTLNLGTGFSPGSAINLNGGNLNLNLGTTLTEGSQVINFNASGGTIGTYGSGANAQINTYDVNSVDINVANGVTGASITSSVNLLTATYGTRIVVGAGASLTMNGLITGSGNAGNILNAGNMIGSDSTAVWFQGTGNLTLTASNNFTAGSSVPVTSVQAGSLTLNGGDNRLPVGSAVYLGSTANGTGQLILNGVNQTITGLTNVGTSSASAVVGGSATLSTLAVNNVNNYSFAGTLGGAGANQNNLALTKTGAGALTLSAANTYTGNTSISAGTLALGAAGSISNSANLILAAGATFDVSAISAYTLTSSNTLNAAGAASAATLNGASGGTVSLGSQPVVLTYDGTHPALTISQGTLVLNGNAFTVNSASPLAPGNYNLVSAGSAITSAGTYSVAGTAIGAGTYGTVAVSGNNVVLAVGTTTLNLFSSENPSGFNDGLTFTASVQTNGLPAANATGTITFQTNGVPFDTETLVGGGATSIAMSTLPRGTNTVTAVYSGDINYLGSAFTLSQVVTNHPPVAGNVTYNLTNGIALKIKISDLLTNVSDADNDFITLTGTTVSSNGVTVLSNGTYLLYQNTNHVNDQFSYQASDGYGGSATGQVSIVYFAVPFIGQKATVSVGGSSATVSFAGIPGYNYGVQRSTNMMDWVTIGTTNAPANGLFIFTDNFSDLGGSIPSSAYYRLGWTP
jgi:autotransporter-associated beta strand protein